MDRWHSAVCDCRCIHQLSFNQGRVDTVAHPPKLVTDPKLIEQLEAAPPDPINFGYLIPTPNPWASVGPAVAIALGIPLVVLILGSSLVWAFSGFAAKRS